MKNTLPQLREMQRNIIGPRLRRARLRARPRLPQQQLAERAAHLGLPLNRGSIAKIEIGLRRVSDYEVLVLAHALNVSLTRLLPMR